MIINKLLLYVTMWRKVHKHNVYKKKLSTKEHRLYNPIYMAFKYKQH